MLVHPLAMIISDASNLLADRLTKLGLALLVLDGQLSNRRLAKLVARP
jgi:hypothetical protein